MWTGFYTCNTFTLLLFFSSTWLQSVPFMLYVTLKRLMKIFTSLYFPPCRMRPVTIRWAPRSSSSDWFFPRFCGWATTQPVRPVRSRACSGSQPLSADGHTVIWESEMWPEIIPSILEHGASERRREHMSYSNERSINILSHRKQTYRLLLPVRNGENLLK